MKKQILKAVVCLLLLVCLLSVFPARAAATEDIIYVSDLYYGYHTSYMSVPLGNYSIATTQIMADVYEDFINDPAFIWTKVSGSLTAVTSPKEMFKIVSDAFIETEFTYNSALTAANEKLALGLLQMTSNQTDLTGTASAIVDRVNAMGDLLSVIYKDCDLESLTDIEAVNKLFDHLITNKTMKALTSAQLEQVRTAILDDLQYIGNLTTAVTSIIDLMGGLYMSLVVEDARFLMLDTILPLAQTGTTLHDGLSLLDRQLSGGFAAYFFENYVINEGLDIATTLGKNYLAGVCPPAALAVGLIDLANNVVFDVIFDVPSVDDFMLQTVLTHYAIDLHTITRDKLDVFEQAFDSADVVEFEQLYAAFSAAVTAGLEATERLTLDKNRAELRSVKDRYGDYDYEAYVNDIIETLSSIEPERRVMKEFIWKPTGTLQVEEASNALKEGYIYEFQGAIHGDLTVTDGLLIEENEVCVIEGDLKHTKGTLTNKGTLHVKGDMEISSGWNFSTYVSIENFGALQVDGDFSMTYPNNGKNYDSSFFDHGTVEIGGDFSLIGPKCRYVSQSTDTLLKIGGDLYASSHSAWGGNIPDINILLNGDSQQTVTNLAVGDLTVANKEGILYGSELRLYGHFDPQGNPTEQYGHLLRALSGNVSFVQGYDYGDVSIEAYIEIANDVTFRNLTMTETLIIGTDTVCTVTGDLLQTNGQLVNNGVLHVKGDLVNSYGWGYATYVSAENFGTLRVDGSLSMTYPNTGKYYSSFFYDHGTVEIGQDLVLAGPKCFFSMQNSDAELILGGECTGNSGNLRASQGTVRCTPAEQANALIEALEPAATTIATEKARASYESLTAWQKQYVSAYKVLTEAEDMLSTTDKFSIAGSNMTLGSTLHLNFNIHPADLSDPDGCTAVVTKMAGDEIKETVTIPASDWSSNQKYHAISFPLAAKEMCTTVYVEVFDKDGKVLSENYSDSIRSYAMRALDSDTLSPQAATMMVDMLLYGSQAQHHFKHERTDLADALLTEEHRAYASEDVVCENMQLKGSNFYGSNLSLESSIELNVFFSGMKGHAVEDMYAEIQFTDQYGKEKHITVPGREFLRHGTSKDIYKIAINAITVGDARQPVTVLVYDEDGELFGSCQDSIESYIKRAETATASPLYAAIMRFAVSTHIYLTTK